MSLAVVKLIHCLQWVFFWPKSGNKCPCAAKKKSHKLRSFDYGMLWTNYQVPKMQSCDCREGAKGRRQNVFSYLSYQEQVQEKMQWCIKHVYAKATTCSLSRSHESRRTQKLCISLVQESANPSTRRCNITQLGMPKT